MRIVTLLENTTCREDLAYEHGLSLYIETGDLRILFDAGQTDAFAENAAKLGVDLAKVDFAVLSHGHYDHGGGLKRFMQINKTAPVYVSRDAFTPHYNGADKYIGLDETLLHSGRLIFVDEKLEIAPDITIYSGRFPLLHPIDPAGLTVLEDCGLQPEDFRHEQYLLIKEQGRSYCFSGCSHRGILNIAAHFHPDVLIGGFHFMKLTAQQDAQRLRAAAEELLRYRTTYYTGHCTGAQAYAFMEPIMGSRLNALSTGTKLYW